MVAIPLLLLARTFVLKSCDTLLKDAKLVFIGHVETVEPDRAVSLGYPTNNGMPFRWLAVKAKVVEPFKGVQAGETITVMMISTNEPAAFAALYNPPVMMNPEIGDTFLFCLSPTPLTNAFAAVNDKWLENLSIMVLHRKSASSHLLDGFFKEILLDTNRVDDLGYETIWSMVDEKGQINPENVHRFRTNYAAAFKSTAASRVIELDWKPSGGPDSRKP